MRSCLSLGVLSGLVAVSTASTKYCDDTSGCASSKSLNEDTIYCNGYQSCNNAEVSSSSSVTDMFCEGLQACLSSTISVSDMVSCDSKQSCKLATLTSEYDAHCDGSMSCYSASVTSSSDIFCDGDEGCRLSEMSATNNIWCDGEESCYFANINNADYISCNGYESCHYTTIINTNNIDGTGYLSLELTDIDTSNINNFYIYLSGDQSGYNGELYCQSESTCTIDCNGLNSCDNFKVYCLGECISYCSEDEGITCPTIYDYNIATDDEINEWENTRQERLQEKEDKINEVKKDVANDNNNDDIATSKNKKKTNKMKVKQNLFDSRHFTADMDGVANENIRVHGKNKQEREMVVVGNSNGNSRMYGVVNDSTALIIVSVMFSMLLTFNVYQCYKSKSDNKYSLLA